MLLDITLPITPQMVDHAIHKLDASLAGHLGTHFDTMDKEFPLEYTRRTGVAFDVSEVRGRDIEASDIDLNRVQQDMFVAFYTAYIEEVNYAEKGYFSEHPQLSEDLIEQLLQKGVSIIALDCGGIRRGKEHTPKDQYCADRGVFVIENLRRLGELTACDTFIAHTYPIPLVGVTGLPCRVIAEL